MPENFREVQEAKEALLAEIRFKRAELVAALDSVSNVLLSQGFVVVSGAGIALQFKVSGQQVSAPSPAGGPHRATRFSKQDAESVASNVIDGRGDHGRAVHVCVALKEAIAETDRVLSMIETA